MALTPGQSGESRSRRPGILERTSCLQHAAVERISSSVQLHDPIRLWASARCSDDERRSVQQELTEYSATILAHANETYLRGGESLRQALDVFDTKRANIETGWGRTCGNADQDEWSDHICARFPVVGVDLLDIQQTLVERIQWLQEPLTAAHRVKDRYTETSLLGDAGTAYCYMAETQQAIEHHARKGEFPHALEYHEQSLAVAREIKDRRGESECIRELAGDYHAIGEATRAFELCDQALSIVTETADKCLEGDCLGDLAAASHTLGELKRAVDLGGQSLRIAREIRNVRSEGSILDTLGRCNAELGDARRAIECHEAHLTIVRDVGDRYGEGDALGNLGNALARSGDARRALGCNQELLKLVRDLGDRRGEAMVLGNIGRAQARPGETRLAIESHSEQLEIAREIGDRHTEGSTLWNTSLVLDKLGKRVQAITNTEAARKIFEETRDAECARVRKQLAEWTDRARGTN